MIPNALTRPSWRGRTNVDLLTITALEQAESRAGFQFVVTQGSYQGGAGDSKSAGTHDGGGVVDLRTRDLTGAQKARMVRALREVGFAAWLRTPAQGFTEHVHAVLGGHPLLHRTAADQWESYRAGRNGLRSNGLDDGPRINPIPTFAALAAITIEETDMPSVEEIWDYPINLGDKPWPARTAMQRAVTNGWNARQESKAALEQARRNRAALEALSAKLDGVAPGVAEAVRKALGDEIKVDVIVTIPAEKE